MYDFEEGKPGSLPTEEEQVAITGLIDALKVTLLAHCHANPSVNNTFSMVMAVMMFAAHTLAKAVKSDPNPRDRRGTPILLLPTALASLFFHPSGVRGSGSQYF